MSYESVKPLHFCYISYVHIISHQSRTLLQQLIMSAQYSTEMICNLIPFLFNFLTGLALGEAAGVRAQGGRTHQQDGVRNLPHTTPVH